MRGPTATAIMATPEESLEKRFRRLLHHVAHSSSLATRWESLHEIRYFLSIDDALSSFPHMALDLEADRILGWQLSCATQGPSVDASMVALLVECLALLWSRSSTERRIKSILASSDLISVLLRVWKRFAFDNHILQPVLAILRLFTKLKDAGLKKALVYSGLLKRIQQSTREITHDNPLRPIILTLIKDLSFRAEVNEKEQMYAECRKCVLGGAQDSCSLVMESASAALWNFAAAERLGRSMSQDEELWDALRHLTTVPVRTESVPIHRNCSSALGTMVAQWTGPEHAQPLPPAALLQQAWIVPHLIHILCHEDDVDWRRRSMRTLRCLASCQWGRDFLYSTSDDKSLNKLLIEVMGCGNDETDTRIQACQTVAELLPASTERWVALWPYLESGLVRILQNETAADNLVLAASRTLQVSLSRCPWKRGTACISSQAIIDRMSAVLHKNTTQVAYHEGFAALLSQLVHDALQQEVGIDGDLMRSILKMVSAMLGQLGPDFENSRTKSIDLVVALAENKPNKKALAEHDQLLTALVSYCLVTTGPSKDHAKQVILSLVSEL